MSSERDTWLTEFELVDLLHVQGSGMTLRAQANKLGVSNQFLCKVMNLETAPGDKIPEAMGYELVKLYRPIEKEKKR